MILIDRLLASGIRFVFDKVARAAEAELDDTANLKEKLLDAQMRLELGELSDEEFADIEADVLARLRAAREEELGTSPAAPGVEITGVEVSVDPSVDEH
jgi:hypothetical protein